jgi:phosphohistidine phosphatase
VALRLILLRHAKSASGGDDHDRPLDERGERAAAAVGVFLAQQEVRPELVLCSSALRTRQTWEGVRAQLGWDPPVRVERGLYLASAAALLERLRRVEDGVGSVLVVAHNPGTGDLAAALAGRGDSRALERLRARFPTAAVADLRLDAAHWGELRPGAAELRAFTTPKDLV